MGSKVKPWHSKQPKFQEEKRKRISPLRAGDDKRIVPLRVHDYDLHEEVADEPLDFQTEE